MVLAQQSSQLLKYLSILVATFVIGWYLFSDRDYHHSLQLAVKGKKGIFVEKALRTDIDGPYDNSSLISFCDRTKWREGLIFQCEAPYGGVANIRNIALNCFRYALEAGATAIVMPEIKLWTPPLDKPDSGHDLEKRKKENVAHVPFSHLFDLDFFQTSLSSACPRIKFIPHANDLYAAPSTQPHSLDPGSLLEDKLPQPFESLLAYPQAWASNFTLWLNATQPSFSAQAPVRITIQPSLLHWPLNHDSPHFVAHFGRLVRPTLEIRTLASTILYSLSQRYNLDLDPEQGIQANKFYGAHLRTSKDAKAAGWTPFEVQTRNYLQAAKHNGLSLIYLVSASEEDIQRFTLHAQNYTTHPITVTTAPQLLSHIPSSLKLYTHLSPAQRSLIDQLVLLKSSIFGGTLESSFSWSVALRRHIVWGNGSWIPQIDDFTWDRGRSGRGKKVGNIGGPVGGYGGGGFQSFRDGAAGSGKEGQGEGREGMGGYGLSVVFGHPWKAQEWERGLWP
ncbi:alteRNAtive oxidase protein [Rutstroemia sp. NJR-2017a WRK4]|nr:alteRNAtive oxidase protein [Rutstroemia sp. NJR-2017a WRK4]